MVSVVSSPSGVRYPSLRCQSKQPPLRNISVTLLLRHVMCATLHRDRVATLAITVRAYLRRKESIYQPYSVFELEDIDATVFCRDASGQVWVKR